MLTVTTCNKDMNVSLLAAKTRPTVTNCSRLTAGNISLILAVTPKQRPHKHTVAASNVFHYPLPFVTLATLDYSHLNSAFCAFCQEPPPSVSTISCKGTTWPDFGKQVAHLCVAEERDPLILCLLKMLLGKPYRRHGRIFMFC